MYLASLSRSDVAASGFSSATGRRRELTEMSSVNGGTSSADGGEEEEDQTTPFPPSAATVAGNDDLLTSILVRLPAKSLIRFKSVSKHWLSLILGRHFSLLHTLLNPNPKPSGIFVSPNPKKQMEYEFIPLTRNNPPFKTLDFVHDPLGIRLLQSCNGLLLCCSFFRSGAPLFTRNCYVYNPTTRNFSIIPPIMFSCSITQMCLAFDPSKSPHYRVFVVKNYHFEIHIYSSETRSWRRCCGNGSDWPVERGAQKQGVFWNDAIHWASKFGLMCFDLDLECRKAMPALPPFSGWLSEWYFGEAGGHLHLVDIQIPIMKIDVFEMERDYSQWTQKYCVDLRQCLAAYPGMVTRDFSIISVVRGESEEDSSLVLHLAGKVISYNLNNKSIKQLRDPLPGEVFERSSVLLGCFDGFQYFESLACV